MSIVKIEELVKPLSRMTNKEQFKQAAMRFEKGNGFKSYRKIQC